MRSFSLKLHDVPDWPARGRCNEHDLSLHLFDSAGQEIYTQSWAPNEGDLKEFELQFIGVTESSVSFATKNQHICAKFRAIMPRLNRWGLHTGAEEYVE